MLLLNASSSLCINGSLLNFKLRLVTCLTEFILQVHVCMHTYMHTCMCVCVCVCLSVCVHVCFTVCICNFSRTLKVSYLFSFAFPESTTKTTSGMVIPVSAMLVARTIFLMPLGGTAKTRFWSSDESTEWSAKIWNLQPNTDHMLVNPEWHLQPNKYWSHAGEPWMTLATKQILITCWWTLNDTCNQTNTDHMLVNPEWHLQPNKYWSHVGEPWMTPATKQILITTADRSHLTDQSSGHHSWQTRLP